MKKFLALCLALMMTLSCIPAVHAAEVVDATIDVSAKGSLTIYKYDVTNAEKDGVWDGSYVSTGVLDQAGVNDILGGTIREGDTDNTSDLGNGQVSYGYAIRGVEFTYLKVADMIQFDEPQTDAAASVQTQILYGIDKTKGADFLKALGLGDGAQRYENADAVDAAKYYYQSDVLIKALGKALDANATTVKNAMERYVAANGGKAMPLTDAYGKTAASNLDLGLYLIVETSVPEMVVCTTNPFLASLPMTSVNGTNATDGGSRWLYDITLYPKNATSIPSLEKTLRENSDDTGKNNGSQTDIADGFAHTGTASSGDVIDYQIISTLPSITSEATYLSCYTFIDTLSKGIAYNKNDVTLEFYSDAACKNLVTSWKESDGEFKVSYNTTEKKDSVMTIEMTEAGLKEINTSKAVYSEAGSVHSGYSDCTIRITYKATVNSDASVSYGDAGNPNDVVLTWKRTSADYYDTLVDDAHLYTYGLELTKLFSDGKGNPKNVAFTIYNKTDGYFVKAELNKAEGVYYVIDHVENEKEATRFVPIASEGNPAKVIVKGLEDDTYIIKEIKTDNGYTLLENTIEVVISQTQSETLCDIYATDTLGLIQNDPRYASVIVDTGDLKNIPQKQLKHYLLTASATVEGKKVNMNPDNGSVNAMVPLSVINTRGFDLPQTGGYGSAMFTVLGVLMMAGAATVIVIIARKKNADSK